MKRLNGKVTNGEFLSRAIVLLKEYTEKFDKIHDAFAESGGTRRNSDKTHERNASFERENLSQLLLNLVPPGTKLARFISQQIEHAALDELAQIELRLRLAEFENAIRAAQKSTNL